MIIVNLTDIVAISILVLVVIVYFIKIVVGKINKIGKKNCYECENYKLYDVCSCGDGCRHKCVKNNRIDDIVSLNCDEHYEKCEEYKRRMINNE